MSVEELSAKLESFTTHVTTHEKSKDDDDDVNELTALLMDSKPTHDPVEEWNKLSNAINDSLHLICFGSNNSPGDSANEDDVASLRKLAHSYMCACNGGLLLLLNKEVQMLRDVIASHDPSVFLVKMHAFCVYLHNEKNREDEEHHKKKLAQKNRALKVRKNSTFKKKNKQYKQNK